MLYEKIIELGNSTFENTENLSHDQWLKLRTTGLGGSDAGAIMGLNEYATPLSIYLAKKDLSSFSGNEATKWGNILEDGVRNCAREDLEIQIEKVPGMFTSKTETFMNANLDGVVFIDGEKTIKNQTVSGLGGHEIKTSKSGFGFSEDEIPDSYYAQVQHYMAVTGLSFFILTAFINETYEMKHYVIRRDQDFIQNLISAEKTFWTENILKNIEPPTTGNKHESDLVKSLPMAECIDLPEEYAALLEKKSEIDKQISELEKNSEAIKEQILLKMSDLSSGQDVEKTTANCGTWKITYNKQVRKSVDTESLKKAGIYDKYTKESVSKVFRVSKAK